MPKAIFIYEHPRSKQRYAAGMVAFEIVVTVLIADFVSGLLHWLEDAYGREEWPITGWLITKANILHHHNPRHFTRHSWLYSSWLLMSLGLVVLFVAWLSGVLTWHVWLFVVLGANANQIHKWAHRSPSENGRVITCLQSIRLLQTPRHHACHHTDPKNSHYCVLTDFVNPILDSIRFWNAFEAAIWVVFRVHRRVDTSVVGRFADKPATLKSLCGSAAKEISDETVCGKALVRASGNAPDPGTDLVQRGL